MHHIHGADAPVHSTWLPDMPGNRAIAVLIACIAAVNAYSFAMVASIPLVQSDVWRFLDGSLGKFITDGFAWSELLAQANPEDTNLPLQKLFLWFHTHYFGMDFRLEGLLGVVAGVLLVLLLARAATALPLRRWTSPECWLLAALALATLSLNSTNVYTWPLATQWFLPLLLAATYFAVVQARIGSGLFLLVATFLLGMLLDEVALPVFVAALAALLLAKPTRSLVAARRLVLFGGGGLVAARLVYWASAVAIGNADAKGSRSFAVLLDTDIWKTAFIPFSDAIIHQANQPALLGDASLAFAWTIVVLSVLAHLWFWWRCVFVARSAERGYAAATFIAAAVMLFFYGLVLGVVLQRVPTFGFDYLHQPRYVMFHQLHLAALAMIFYRDYRYAPAYRGRQVAAAVMVSVILAFGALQVRLSTMAWEHAKYLSKYVEGAALTLGRLAADPAADIPCADILTVCDYPVEKRRAMLDLLVRHRLNIFSPEFQAFHRLYPYPPVAVPAPKSASGEAGGPASPAPVSQDSKAP